MLTVSQLSKSFGGTTLFQDASLQVNKGDRIGLIGPNGAGKTTLFSLILGDSSPDEGTVSLQRGATIGFLPQESAPAGEETILELATSISPEMTAAQRALREFPDENSHEHHEAHARFVEHDGYALEAKAKRILSGLAFAEADFAKPAKTLSGGWIMRAHLARLLVMEPSLLMLDEPTNHLDLETLGWFQNYLGTTASAILTISHDRAFLNATIRSVVEISRGRLHRYPGNYDQYVQEKKAREEHYAAAYRNQQREIAQLEDFVNRFRAKASKAAQAQERIKRLARMERLAPPDNPEATVKFRFPQPPRGGQKVAELVGVRQAYGDHVVYQNLDLLIEKGLRTVLVGPNGAGKSTLLKILAGVVPISGGTMKLGHNISVGYFAQHRTETLRVEKTVLEEAIEGVESLGEQAVRTVLGSFLFRGDDVFKPVGVLSGGEKSRLALAKLLLNPPNFLLLDEPTTHLDIASIDALVGALSQYEGTLLFVSHDVHFIRTLATTVLHIHAGRVTPYAGDYAYYLEKSQAVSERGGLVAALSDHRPPEAISSQPDQPTQPARPKLGLKEIREQRRAEAEARKAANKIRRDAEAQAAALEEEIVALEIKQRTLANALEKPDDASSAFALNRELIQIGEKLDSANAKWGELAGSLEA